jgi:hypothetical protein
MNLQSSIFNLLGIWPGDAPAEHVFKWSWIFTWASRGTTRLAVEINKEALRLFVLFLESIAGVFEKLDDRSREGGGRGGDAITTQRRFS